MRCTRGSAHHDAALLDELRRSGGSVLVTLHAAARIAVAIKGVDIALLLVGAVLFAASKPSSQHGTTVPERR